LFWAGGMRLAWRTAIEFGLFDYFWLVNDDTFIYIDTLHNLLKADDYSIKEYGKQGIYVGSTFDPNTKKHSYGGQKLLSKDNYACEKVLPNDHYQTCQFCNANILLVTTAVVNKIGIFCSNYTHSIADFDYSIQAFNAGFPVLVLPTYCGECINDHKKDSTSQSSQIIIKRLQYLFSPKGFAYKEFLYSVHKFFPSTYRKTIITLWIRTIFPSIWEKHKASRKPFDK
jgi:GT2 family glycosyltransferase